MSSSSRRQFPFAGFHIGPSAAALILSAGILACIRAIQDPLTWAVVAGINYFLHRSYPDTFPIQQVYFVWQFQVAYAIMGIILLGIGLRFAFWISLPAASQKEN